MVQQSQHRTILLSAEIATLGQRRLALGVSLLILAAFIVTVPFGRIAGPTSPKVAVALHTVLAVNDLITAVLLFGQYSIQPARRVVVLAGGYLFTAMISIPFLLSFPGPLPSAEFFDIGPRSAPWLYAVWHGGLSLAVIAYSSVPEQQEAGEQRIIRRRIVVTASAALAAATAIGIFAIVGHDWLPVGKIGAEYTATGLTAVSTLVALPLIALALLARRRPYAVLDQWLMVVMFAWLCTIVLAAVSGTNRYDIGFYGSRGFAMVASTIVLIVLLSEINTLYARAIGERERRLKEIEAVAIHLSRVSELGQDISSLIHEVSQPLTTISIYLTVSLQHLNSSNTKELRQDLKLAQSETMRAIDIVHHLRDFIKRREGKMQIVDVPKILQEAGRLALVGVRQTPIVTTQCNPNAARAFCDPVQIEQVVFNLVRNAAEAMAESAERALTMTAALDGDGMVQIMVADTGAGLTPDVRARLFEPFVTSKANGLGVGLSISRAIVEAHGGLLVAKDNPGGGTVFSFTIPVAQGAS
jgi:signal transduction histidine kinase